MSRNKTSLDPKAIQERIDEVRHYIRLADFVTVEPVDLIRYFDGEAPSGDITTLDDVLESDWLLIHELVELSELKKAGLEISIDLLTSNVTEVEHAHMLATEIELEAAAQANDKEYIRKRLESVRYWLEDILPELRPRVIAILEKYRDI